MIIKVEYVQSGMGASPLQGTYRIDSIHAFLIVLDLIRVAGEAESILTDF